MFCQSELSKHFSPKLYTQQSWYCYGVVAPLKQCKSIVFKGRGVSQCYGCQGYSLFAKSLKLFLSNASWHSEELNFSLRWESVMYHSHIQTDEINWSLYSVADVPWCTTRFDEYDPWQSTPRRMFYSWKSWLMRLIQHSNWVSNVISCFRPSPLYFI